MNVQDSLNLLDEYYAQRDLHILEKKDLIDSVLTAEIRQQVADIETEFANRTAAINENIANLEAEIKAAVVQNGASVKGEHLQAVFMKGRVSWDTAKLDGMMVLLPQLEQARKVGEPSCTIRKTG